MNTKINGMPKQIICEGTLFTLGAIDEYGDGYYLSANYGFIRASDMYVPKTDDIPRYEEYAVNGLYFEYDMDGYLSDYVYEMLGSPKCKILTEEMRKFIEKEGIKMKSGTIIAIKGNLWEYDQYDEKAKMHIAHEILIDDEGRLTATYTPYAFTDEELKDNAVNFTKSQWYGIVEHFIRQAHDLTDEDISTATEDIVGRCFAYGIPTIEELPEYIAEYLNR